MALHALIWKKRKRAYKADKSLRNAIPIYYLDDCLEQTVVREILVLHSATRTDHGKTWLMPVSAEAVQLSGYFLMRILTVFLKRNACASYAALQLNSC